MKLKIAYLYYQELNLYGDTGNVEILLARAQKRGLAAEAEVVGLATKISTDFFKNFNLVFMGGGPDSGQTKMYLDLLEQKGPYLKDYIEGGGVSLFICGSYQLMGKYYQASTGALFKGKDVLTGLNVFDLYTVHPGHHRPRCVGNVVAKISPAIVNDPVFKNVNKLSEMMVGFENHGGRTYLGKGVSSLAQVIYGFGNNGKDKTEGIYYKNSLGTYFHGPFLSKNPHLADFLIAKSLGLENLPTLDDTLINKAHTALIQRFK